VFPAEQVIDERAVALPSAPRQARHMLGRVRSFVVRRRRMLLAASTVVIATPLVCDLVVGAGTAVFTDPAKVPHHRVALVLGTSPTVAGRANLFYTARLAAAAELYHAGAVDGLLVSGDNGSHAYDEPTAMKDGLVALGVPAAHVTCDFAGFRTLDSIVRAKHVFGLDAFVIVSQPFHAQRAVFLARAHGIDALAFGASNPNMKAWLKVRARETAARTLAVFDVLAGTEPKFLGEPVEVVVRTER
jgi:SanA protein